MKTALTNILVDPIDLRPLRLKAFEFTPEEVIAGTLETGNGAVYAVRNGIPRLVVTEDVGQLQTSSIFAFKWRKRETFDSEASRARAARWCVEKYGFQTLEDWAGYFAGRQKIADIGCGCGFSSSLWLLTPQWDGRAMWVGVDISEAIDVARERLGDLPNTHFVQGDALSLPFPDGSFDTIFSEGVLHHTPSTRTALLSCARLLAPGGEFHFYVYRRKSPIREFTDDYVRQEIAGLSDEDAWEAMRPLTELGRALAEADTVVELRRDIAVLGIPAGRYDIQRLFYWHFAKAFWDPDLSLEENVHINFDWYRPHFCHRHHAGDIREWCAEAGMDIRWFHEQESGYSVRAVKR